MYAPLLNRIGALSLDVIWAFETTSHFLSHVRCPEMQFWEGLKVDLKQANRIAGQTSVETISKIVDYVQVPRHSAGFHISLYKIKTVFNKLQMFYISFFCLLLAAA